MASPCVVRGCKNIGTHLFPRDEIRKGQWINAIRYIKSGFTLKKNSLICLNHFHPTEFSFAIDDSRRLKKHAIPSIFPWNQTHQPAPLSQEPQPQVKDHSTETMNIDITAVQKTYSRIPSIAFVEIPNFFTSSSESNDDPLQEIKQEIEIQCTNDNHAEVIEVIQNYEDQTQSLQFDNIVEISTGTKVISVQTQTPENVFAEFGCVQTHPEILLDETEIHSDAKTSAFSIYNYKDSKSIHYYTGLESLSKLMLVFYSLGDSHNLKYLYGSPPARIDCLEQFFITLIILRRHKTFEEITMLFKITLKQVYSIFTTWVRFMALQWKNLDLWVEKNCVKAYMPYDFNEKYPATRLVLDATESPIKKPKLPLAQQVSFSTYKNRNTIKFLIGITPGGMISYVSPSYAGSATDRQILERSPILEKFDYNDEIMVDKGFNVQDIFIQYGVKVNMPAFFKRGNQIKPDTLYSNRKVASKRVHIERVIGMMKTYRILTEPMNQTETLLSSDIVLIIAMLVNFRSNIINKNT